MEGLAVGTINLLVLPILGGYWFQYKFVGTHYRAERLPPQRLVFHAAMFAILLFGAARLLVDLANSHWQRNGVVVELLMFIAIPAFIVLVLASLVMISVMTYIPSSQRSNSSSDVSSSLNTSANSLLASGTNLARTAIGVFIVVFLLWLSAYIIPAMHAAASTPAELLLVAFFLVLLAATALHHEFINRYIEFPFFSIALRIGLFGVMGSLALAWFLFDYSFIHKSWAQLVHVRGSGIPMLAFALGLVSWWPLNLLYPYQAANTRLHAANKTTALDRLLYQASLAQHLLSISMKDGKVYIGYIQELPPNPEDRNSYFEILPVHSGYRDKDTREMKLTTFYENAYERLVESGADEEDWIVFLKVLKIDDILSAGRFDPEVYVKFNEKPSDQDESEIADDRSG
jgi:hypothetical protein